MTAGVIQRGRHRLNSVQDLPALTGDPRDFLAGDGAWGVPGATVDYQAFVAAVPVAAGQPLALRADGKVELADRTDLGQFNLYAGLALDDAAVDGTVHVQTVGVREFPQWNWQPRLPVFVGTLGQLTQDIPAEGYLLSVGMATTASRLFLQPWIPVVCPGSSNAYFQGANGGGGAAAEPLWATPQDIRDGISSEHAINPAALKVVVDELIAQYGVTAARKATLADVNAGVPDKLVTAQVLRDRLNAPGGAASLDYASTEEIEAGILWNKVVSPAALHPILVGLAAGPDLEYATAADVAAGVSGTRAVTPLALIGALNDLRDADRILGDSIPALATPAEVAAGTREDVYVSPARLAVALGEVRDEIPADAVSSSQLAAALAALALPLPADGDDLAAGVAPGKYVTVTQLYDLTQRVTAVEGFEVPWATEAEVLAGTVEGRAVDPAGLQAKIDTLALGGGGGGSVLAFATPDEAAAGLAHDRIVTPYALGAALAARQSVRVGELGDFYLDGA
jgi:hypothetical protein